MERDLPALCALLGGLAQPERCRTLEDLWL